MTKKLVYNDVTTDANGNLVFDNLSMTYTYYWNGTTFVGYTASNGIEMFSVKVIYGDDGDPDGFTVTDSSEEQFAYFYTKNLQGDITGILTVGGNVCVTLDYDAYGLPSFTITGNTADAIISLAFTPFLYRGYMYDHDTGLYYLQSRFYNPLYGRFLNADEMEIAYLMQGDVTGANLFAYCGNNPVNNSDPTGYKSAIKFKASGIYIYLSHKFVVNYNKILSLFVAVNMVSGGLASVIKKPAYRVLVGMLSFLKQLLPYAAIVIGFHRIFSWILDAVDKGNGVVVRFWYAPQVLTGVWAQ